LRCVLRLRLRCVFFRRRFLRYSMRFMRDTGYLRFAICVLRALFVLLLRLDAVVRFYSSSSFRPFSSRLIYIDLTSFHGPLLILTIYDHRAALGEIGGQICVRFLPEYISALGLLLRDFFLLFYFAIYAFFCYAMRFRLLHQCDL
jgi:hypothetical protein